MQGSGAILGPCLSNLIGRELRKVAPCLCVRCSRLPPTLADRNPLQNTSRYITTNYTAGIPANRLPGVPSVVAPSASAVPLTCGGPASAPLDQLRQRYPGARFREQYATKFTTPLPHLLGSGPPVLVNLNFACAPDSQTGIQYRLLHSSSVLGKKPSSKLEETVIRLKERQQDALSELSKVEDLEKTIQNVIEKDEQLSQAVKVSVEKKAAEKTAPKKSMWTRVVDEAKHYYSGFKLLFLDVKVSSKIIYKVVHGKTLSRRENRQLVRTVSDLFRLVPFSVFILVPFMELLLPVALKLFPGMLPSTFTSQDEREVKMRRALKAKLEYAKFLQQTLDEMGPTSKGYKSESARGFVNFYNTVKQEGTTVTNKDILKFSKLFEDELTLDNMTRGQLVALCRLLELTPMGTNAFLRFQLEMQLRKLKADDLLIAREGIESMSVTELQVACKDRGMRAIGITKEKLRQQLNQWIELSTNEQVPPSLLLLSRTLFLPAAVDPATQIAAAVSALPETAATGAKAKIGEREGKIENATRLELIKAEQVKIDEETREQERLDKEKEQRELNEKEKQSRLAKEALERAIEEQSLGVPPPASPSAHSIVNEGVSILRKATVAADGALRHAAEPGGQPATLDDIHVGHVIQEVKSAKPAITSPITKELSNDDLNALRNAISAITKEKGNTFINEHEVLLELKQELTDYEEDLGELNEQAELTGRKDLRQSKGAARLFSRVNNMLNSINSVVEKLEDKEKDLAHQIDELGEVGAATGKHEGHLVTVQELLQAVRGIQDVPDSSRLERIGEVVARMDDDSDGIVKVEHVNKVIELLGRDNVNLSTKQVKQIIELIGKEEMLEVEGRIEKLLGKIPNYEQTSKQIQLIKEAEEIKDTAVDLTEIDSELHVSNLLRRPVTQETSESREPSEGSAPILLSREQEPGVDNTVKEVTHQVEKDLDAGNHQEERASTEEKDQKITQKNGSKH